MLPAQLTAFKNAITGDGTQSANVSAANHGAIAAYYAAATTTQIYRPFISASEVNTNVVWSEYATLGIALQNTYQAMLSGGSIDATSTNIRNGFATVFTTVLAPLTRANMITMATRAATRFEALFVTNGVCSVFGQQASVADVIAALGSP